LALLNRAVEAQDLEAAKGAFAPPYRAALQQWADGTGEAEVIQTLRAGLTASRDASLLYTIVRYTRAGEVRWETKAATWENAQPIVTAALADTAVSRVEIEHRGFVFGAYGGAWLLERW
jgi:hypothetical protein